MKNSVELEAAEALLDVGISLPLFRIRMPWGKGWTWRVVMRRPCLGSQMRIARQFLKLGITSQQVERFTDDQEPSLLCRTPPRALDDGGLRRLQELSLGADPRSRS